MLVGHIIVAHKSPDQLKRLVNRLLHPSASVFIHIDKATDIRPFKNAINHGNVHFIKNRVKVNWGGFSQVEAFVNAMAECLMTLPALDYLNILSGQDYPIKSNADFLEHLSTNQGSVFMEFVNSDDKWLQEARRRVTQYHITDLKFFGQYKLEWLINKVMPVRKLPPDFELVGRSQWFTVDRESVLYILDVVKNKKSLVRCFRYSWGADELFFQSILYNSHLRYKLINDNLRYIDWSAQQSSPKVLTIKDADALLQTGGFFARKFDPAVDEHILDYIDENCLINK